MVGGRKQGPNETSPLRTKGRGVVDRSNLRPRSFIFSPPSDSETRTGTKREEDLRDRISRQDFSLLQGTSDVEPQTRLGPLNKIVVQFGLFIFAGPRAGGTVYPRTRAWRSEKVSARDATRFFLRSFPFERRCSSEMRSESTRP